MSRVRVGDLLPQGRVVAVQEETLNRKGYAWVERKCPDGTVEREAFFLDELGSPVDAESGVRE